jgi:hypothetical protein
MQNSNHTLKNSPYTLVTSEESRYRRRRSRPRTACWTFQEKTEIPKNNDDSSGTTLNCKENETVPEGDDHYVTHFAEKSEAPITNSDTSCFNRVNSIHETKDSIRKLAVGGKIASRRPFTAQTKGHEIRTQKNCLTDQKQSTQAWASLPTDRDNLTTTAEPHSNVAATKFTVKLGGLQALQKNAALNAAVRPPRQILSAKASFSHPQRAPFVAAARPRALSTEQRLAHIRELLQKNGGDCTGIDPLLFFEMGEEVSAPFPHVVMPFASLSLLVFFCMSLPVSACPPVLLDPAMCDRAREVLSISSSHPAILCAVWLSSTRRCWSLTYVVTLTLARSSLRLSLPSSRAHINEFSAPFASVLRLWAATHLIISLTHT